MNMEKFLKNIGLVQYLPNFLDNGVDDFETLASLTEVHLERIGLKIGHSVKLLKAIAVHLADGPQASAPHNPFFEAQELFKVAFLKTTKPEDKQST